MVEPRIMALEKFKVDELSDKIEEHAYNWNIKRKCKCMPSKGLVDKEAIIICKHLLEDREKIFQKRIDKYFNRAIVLGVVALKSTQATPTKNYRQTLSESFEDLKMVIKTQYKDLQYTLTMEKIQSIFNATKLRDTIII